MSRLFFDFFKNFFSKQKSVFALSFISIPHQLKVMLDLKLNFL